MPPRKSLTKSQLQSAVALELVDLLETITADGQINESEATALQAWLDDREVSELPAIEYLRSILMHVLEDGKVTPAEALEVYKAVEKVLPVEARRDANERRLAREAVLRAEQQQAKDEERAKQDAVARENAKNLPITTFDFIVAGVSYENRHYIVQRYANPGDRVHLAREPTNPHDGNAIKVLLRDGQTIGYIPRDTASWLRHSLDSGHKPVATIKKILDGRRYNTPVIAVALYPANTTIAEAEATPAVHYKPATYRSIHVDSPLKSAPDETGCGDGCVHGCATLIGVVVLLSLFSMAGC